MTYILVIWTVVACSHSHCKSDWRPIAEFQGKGLVLCEGAAHQMNLKPSEYRCIQVKQ